MKNLQDHPPLDTIAASEKCRCRQDMTRLTAGLSANGFEARCHEGGHALFHREKVIRAAQAAR
jgi:hypothetical protein